MKLDYIHRHSAHCETGATSAMMTHHGLDISEAMTFGVGSGLYFVHMKWIKLYGMPLTNFRSYPGSIMKLTAKRLGVSFKFQTFRRPEAAMKALDEALEAGRPTGLRVGIYWLPYVPEPVRAQFNAHNIIIYGKKGDEYYVSDPVFDQTALIASKDLVKARFAQGPLAPKGTMYYLTSAPNAPDFTGPIKQGLKDVIRNNTRPFPNFLGVKGINLMAGKIPVWLESLGGEAARQHLAMIVRMQEEIGSGGGGFRFIFASFLAEAADIIGREDLREFSERFAKIGDEWRVFALKAARICKKKSDDPDKYKAAADILYGVAKLENAVLRDMKKAGY